MKIHVPYFRIKGLQLPGQILFRNIPFEGAVPNTGCYLSQRFTVNKKKSLLELVTEALAPFIAGI